MQCRARICQRGVPLLCLGERLKRRPDASPSPGKAAREQPAARGSQQQCSARQTTKEAATHPPRLGFRAPQSGRDGGSYTVRTPVRDKPAHPHVFRPGKLLPAKYLFCRNHGSLLDSRASGSRLSLQTAASRLPTQYDAAFNCGQPSQDARGRLFAMHAVGANEALGGSLSV